MLYLYTQYYKHPSNRIPSNSSHFAQHLTGASINYDGPHVTSNQPYDSKLCRLGLALAPLVATVPLLWFSCDVADGPLGPSVFAWLAWGLGWTGAEVDGC